MRGVPTVRRFPPALTTAAFAVTTASLAIAPLHAEDDWPRYGHDGALTGRSSLAGDILEPRLAWNFAVAGTTTTLALLAESGVASVTVPGPVDAGAGNPVKPWDLEAGRETHHARWADLLPDVPGLEQVAWDNTWTTAPICRLECFVHEPGSDKPRRVWQTDPPEPNIFSPLNVILDIDADGVLEVVVAAHYRVMIFEGTTGRKESELVYHQNRPYGWLGLYDVDADGQKEIVTLGDFQSHLDVLGYDPAKPEPERLTVKWRRDLESDITRREKWPQLGPRPVGDFAGDGKLEIALNYFNEHGDGQWHTQLIDASSGAVLVDLPRRYLQGSSDVNGDGKLEIFLATTTGVIVPRFGEIELRRFEGRETRIVHASTDAAWVLADLPRLGATWSTTATDGMRHVLTTEVTGQRPWWLEWKRQLPATATSATQALLALVAVQFDVESVVVEAWRVSGLPGAARAMAIAADPSPRALVELRLAPGESCTVLCRGARPLLTSTAPDAGLNAMPVVARLEKSKPPVVVVEAVGGRILALDPPEKPCGTATKRWIAPGRGMTDGSRLCGLAACDLDGDGHRELLAADEHPDGVAQLVAYNADGTVRWRARFDGFPGGAPVWNHSGFTFFWPGRFRHCDRDDVLVSLRRGFMHSDVGVLIDGHSGKEVWRQTSATVPGVFHWGFAGNVIAAADVVGDANEEIVNLYPVCFWLGDGSTGNLVHARDLASRQVVPAWAAYGEPIVGDFTGDGKKDVLLDSGYILALLDSSGGAQWHGSPRADYPTGKPDDGFGNTTDTRHALADLDGDGSCELVSAGYGNGFRALDPRTGKMLWALDAPAPTMPKVAAANIDGEPGDEAIYCAGNALIAVTGNRQSGSVLWTWRGSAPLGLPAIADVDGDGKAEIVVRSADGVIHCLDGPAAED